MGTQTKRLVRARHTRSQIATMFSDLDNGHITVTEILQDPPACLTRIRVYDVLRRVPHLNRDGAEKVLRSSKVWPLRTMGELLTEERQAILTHLPPRVKQ